MPLFEIVRYGHMASRGTTHSTTCHADTGAPRDMRRSTGALFAMRPEKQSASPQFGQRARSVMKVSTIPFRYRRGLS